VSDKNEESPFGRVIIEQLAEPDVDLSDVEIKSSPPWRLLVSLERRGSGKPPEAVACPRRAIPSFLFSARLKRL
jgi:hypothetical protein